MSNILDLLIVQHAIFICILILITLPNILSRKKEKEFRRQIIYDISHFIIYQSTLGVYISYLAVFYLPVLISREISNLINFNFFRNENPLKGLPKEIIVIFYYIYWDLLAYTFHRLSHKIEFLWKIHKYHHSTIYFTGFSAYRVSFIENGIRICFYTIMLLPVISQIAEPPIWMGYILAIFTFVKHNEFYCKKNLTWWPDLIIQSPRMHWLHHSLDGPYGKNFAEVFSAWDVIFKTYDRFNKKGHVNFEDYRIGVKERKYPDYYSDLYDINNSLIKYNKKIS